MRRTLGLLLGSAALLAATALDSPCRAGSTQVQWHGVGVRIGHDAAPANARATSPREAGRALRRQVEAAVMLQLRAIGLRLAQIAASDVGAPRGFAILSALPWLAPMRPNVNPRAPEQVLAFLHAPPFTPVSAPSPLEAATAAAIAVTSAGNQLLDAIASHADSATGRARREAYAQSLERCARELDALGQSAADPADTTPVPPAAAEPRLERRWGALDADERALLARANVTPPEIEDLASWLGAGRLELRAPVSLSDDPLQQAAQIARSCGSPPDPAGPTAPPVAPALIVRAGAPAALTAAGDNWRYARVFDAAGRCVRHLMRGSSPRLAWDGRGDDGHPVARGAYFVLIERPDGALTLHVIVLP